MEPSSQSNEALGSFARLLSKTVPPWVFRVHTGNITLKETVDCWKSAEPGNRVIELDGSRMRTIDSCYDELTRKLRLPDYFGRNLAALDECMSDGEIMEGTGFFILIVNGDDMLAWSSSSALEGLLSTFETIAASWSVPVTAGEWWDRPAYPFHFGIQIAGTASSLLQRLPLAGC